MKTRYTPKMTSDAEIKFANMNTKLDGTLKTLITSQVESLLKNAHCERTAAETAAIESTKRTTKTTT